ncbi:uncharacterized protein LOC106080832 [Stomoxys calcitrans]|uniref:uncharacterized protein LOC106080832 n=1 Tax=Stomoxys calcitrans TaxID=35570 RepID=UPI0027E2431D|nr:uncharacterized protein LOC106080832 [Stomoxys calcitrans]
MKRFCFCQVQKRKMQSIKLVQCVVVVFCVALIHLPGVHMDTDEDETNVSGRIIYDQRQSGKYNIHVVIKDVAIIEMGQNEIEDSSYNDEDYYYDDNDLTVKPITLNPPTSTSTAQIPTSTTTTTTSKSEEHSTTPNMESESSTKQATTESETTFPKQQKDETATLTPATIIWNTLSSIISKKPIKEELSPPSPTPFSKHSNAHVRPRSKVEPIYAIDEESKAREDSVPIDAEPKLMKNSKIFKVKVHRSPYPPHHYSPLKIQSRRCRSNQYRDISGNCRTKRSPSSSLLNRLFHMLVTLPFVHGEQHQNED